MKKKNLPPTYRKILFWQMLVWLVLVAGCIITGIGFLEAYRKLKSFPSNYHTVYMIYLIIGFLNWGALIAFLVQFNKSIRVGMSYEEQRGAEKFGEWLRELRKTWSYFLILVLLLLIGGLFLQLTMGVSIL